MRKCPWCGNTIKEVRSHCNISREQLGGQHQLQVEFHGECPTCQVDFEWSQQVTAAPQSYARRATDEVASQTPKDAVEVPSETSSVEALRHALAGAPRDLWQWGQLQIQSLRLDQPVLLRPVWRNGELANAFCDEESILRGALLDFRDRSTVIESRKRENLALQDRSSNDVAYVAELDRQLRVLKAADQAAMARLSLIARVRAAMLAAQSTSIGAPNT